MMKLLMMSTFMISSKTKINMHMLITPFIMILFMLKMYSNKIYLINSSFNLDSLSIMMMILSMMSTSLIILSSNSLKMIYYTIYPIMITLILAFSISNLFWFYILFETVLIPTMILIMKIGKQPERLQASIYLIIYTITASLPLLVCIMYMKNNFSFYYSYLLMNNFKFSMILLLAFLVKMPMFFSHLWLPKAHVEAPLEGSMILAAVLLKLGGYGLIRLLPLCLNSLFNMKYWMMSISMLGASMTSMICMRQKDMKALIAYSSVAHMAMTLMSIFSMNSMGLMGAIMMMIAHGLSSSALFFLVNDLYMKIHSRNIIMFKGLMSLTPNITFWWFIFIAINMSAPPSINTISEIFIMSSLLTWSNLTLLPIMISSFLTASFCISLFINIIHNKNEMKFFKSSSIKTFMSLFIHMIPLIILLFKMETMM